MGPMTKLSYPEKLRLSLRIPWKPQGQVQGLLYNWNKKEPLR